MDTQYRRRFLSLIQQRFERWHLDWLSRRAPAQALVRLGGRNIYILPTGQGLLFVITSVVVFVAAINYALSLAFALSFLMTGVFLLTLVHTFMNLQGITLRGHGAEACFAGDSAVFKIIVQRDDKRIREAIDVGVADTASHTKTDNKSSAKNKYNGQIANLNHSLTTEVFLAVKAPQRGLFKAPRLMVKTAYPLGLWEAWSRPDLDLQCLVYPRPQVCELPASSGAGDSADNLASVPGNEDFYGLRNYQPGDSKRQIAWKTLARGQGLKTKQFVDPCDFNVMLDWTQFSGLDLETRLSCLCYQVLQLSARDVDFGLRLPGQEFAPDRGEEHRRKLLEALALWS
ncbi:MAG: DUF58 domain-containing protein [Pseudohongiella sp.]|nr:DUF58 domain-containing protein [Pseudohongiella sp.]